MLNTQKQVLNVLLKSIMDKKLIPNRIYDEAVDLINSTPDLAEFFRYPVCCHEEEENNGCS